jgi:3-methylcrotonyl-CoA carboxylase alpha subunit
LLAKVIAYGHDREEARRRAVVALDEFMLAGVLHTAAFLRDVVAGERFARGDLSTAFVPEFLPAWYPDEQPMKVAAVLAALAAQSGPASASQAARAAGAESRARSPWEALGSFDFGSRR